MVSVGEFGNIVRKIHLLSTRIVKELEVTCFLGVVGAFDNLDLRFGFKVAQPQENNYFLSIKCCTGDVKLQVDAKCS